MNVSVSTQEILSVIGAFTVATNAVFLVAFLLGRLWARLDRNEKSVAVLEARMDRAGEKMSDLANEVQALPNRFLLRQEAAIWRGSRADDPR